MNAESAYKDFVRRISATEGSMTVRFYNLVYDLQHKHNNWWPTFAASCRQQHSGGCQASHSLAPPKLTPRTRSTHRRQEGSVVSRWYVPCIALFWLMFCSHLQNFVFSRSHTTTTMMGAEPITVRNWRLGAQVDRIVKLVTTFEGKNQLPSLHYWLCCQNMLLTCTRFFILSANKNTFGIHKTKPSAAINWRGNKRKKNSLWICKSLQKVRWFLFSTDFYFIIFNQLSNLILLLITTVLPNHIHTINVDILAIDEQVFHIANRDPSVVGCWIWRSVVGIGVWWPCLMRRVHIICAAWYIQIYARDGFVMMHRTCLLSVRYLNINQRIVS